MTRAASPAADPRATLIENFLDAYNAADLPRLRNHLADDLVSYLTGPNGETRRFDGADAFIAGTAAMDLPSARFSVRQTQAPVLIDDDRVLLMVEVHASRNARTLLNYAAYLLRVADGRVTEFRMVDAKPAESDAFWATPTPD